VPITLRDFQAKDFEALWRMDQRCFPEGISYSRPELRAYIRRRESFTLVAVDAVTLDTDNKDTDNQCGEGAIAGFLVGHGGTAGHIITIDVDPSARRSGVGSQLLRGAEDRLRAGGSKMVGLETAVDNLPALRFYKRHGYTVVKTWPRYYSNGVDALVLKKELEVRV
jgi:[ribosomal protein S18]-alanine N-acetyltransferase